MSLKQKYITCYAHHYWKGLQGFKQEVCKVFERYHGNCLEMLMQYLSDFFLVFLFIYYYYYLVCFLFVCFGIVVFFGGGELISSYAIIQCHTETRFPVIQHNNSNWVNSIWRVPTLWHTSNDSRLQILY